MEGRKETEIESGGRKRSQIERKREEGGERSGAEKESRKKSEVTPRGKLDWLPPLLSRPVFLDT